MSDDGVEVVERLRSVPDNSEPLWENTVAEANGAE